MKRAATIFTLITMWAGIAVGAQQPAAVSATSATGDTSRDTSIFAPLRLVQEPNRYRDARGAPGPAYWQNRADYDLHATQWIHEELWVETEFDSDHDGARHCTKSWCRSGTPRRPSRIRSSPKRWGT